MKTTTITHKNLNNGNPTTLHVPISEEEFKNQAGEIFNSEHYEAGRVKSGVYVDLGANIGLTALYFKDYARKYYAVEPSRECFEALKENTKDLKNIELFNFAISSFDGEDTMYKTAIDSTTQNFFAPGEIYGRETVKCKRIDTFFEENNIDHVDVLKIDVESMEYVIFADDSFGKVAPKIDLIVGEAHYNTFYGGIPQIIPLMLEEYGFKTEFLSKKNYIYKLSVTNREGKIKHYNYECGTIFVARREK